MARDVNRDTPAAAVLLFSGFGTSGPGLIRQLRNLYRRPGDRELLEVAAHCVDRALDRIGPDGARLLLEDVFDDPRAATLAGIMAAGVGHTRGAAGTA